MTDHTIRIIYAIKRGGDTWNRAVAKYMSEYSGYPYKDYTEMQLNNILKEAFLDYLSTCDNPVLAVRDLIDSMTGHGLESLGFHISNVFMMARVKFEDKYINGFRDVTETDIKQGGKKHDKTRGYK